MRLYLKIFFSELAYKSHPYSEEIAMHLAVSYILYATSYHEKTGYIRTFAQFEGVNLVENKCNVAWYESILASIDESSTYNDSDDGYISKNAPEDIQDGNIYVQILMQEMLYW